ncbi:hypothetical protein EC844_103216, partial [Acinetobacter calcoaceticus]
MSEIQVISKETHQVLESVTGNAVSISEASVVVLKINKEDVVSIVQKGVDAVITLKSGEEIIIGHFFEGENYKTDNSLVFNDEGQNKLIWVQFTDANSALLENITLSYIDSIEPLLYHDGATSLWAWLAVPVGAAGIIAWAGNDSDSDQSPPRIILEKPTINPPNGNDPITGTAPPGTQVEVTFPNGDKQVVDVGPDGKWSVPNPGLEDGDEIKAETKDPEGNVSPPSYAIIDGVAPDAPIVDTPNVKDPITGSAEPGSEVTVTFPDGSTEVTKAGPDGKWSVPNPGLKDGDEVKATAKDPAGNVSDPGYATVDGAAPNAPHIDPPNAEDPITGSAPPRSEIEVTFPNGDKENTTAGPDGKWSVPNPGLEDGDEIKAETKDPEGNVSPPSYAIVDGVAPDAPIVDTPNVKDPITGSAEPGSEVTVTFPDGSTEVTTAGPDGKWSVPNPGLKDGDEVKATAKDPAGNVSDPGYATVDGAAPNAPHIDPPNAEDPITGSAPPGSEVEVTFPNGDKENTTAGPDGKWSVPNPGLEDGDEIKAETKDPEGNVSPPSYAIVDGVAPDAPIIDQPNTSDPVTGSAEPNSEVTVTFPDGSTEVTTTGPDGKWSVPNPGLKDGDEVKATAKDPAGNVSDPGYATVDGVAPDAPHIDPPNANDPITGGGANPGDEVIVTFPNGDQETTTAGPDGTWSVPNPGLVDGDEIKAETKDPEGNVSPPAYAIVDGVAPDAPIIDQPNRSDPVTGSAEPNSEVTVTFPDGSTEVTTAGPDGKWSVPNPGLKDGDEVQATAKDPAGNVSDPGYATVDGAAPNAPHIDPPNANDPITGGGANPGDEVIVTFPNGDQETTIAGPDGTWSVPNPGLVDGDEIKAETKDPEGNVSPPAYAIVDGVAPNAPHIDPPNANDPITGGGANPGDEVIVTFPNGDQETTIAGPDGTWSVPNPGLVDGDEVKATAKDPAGNVSDPGYATVDGAAPNAPHIDPPNANDPITGGGANPGDEVIVTFPNGDQETTIAGPDGTWSVPNPGLVDGDEIKAETKDPEGNVSPPAYAIVDGVAPDAPIIDQPNISDPVTGSAEPNSEVTVTFPDGSTEVTTAGPDGKWSVPNPGLQDGDEVKATAKDPAGNVSDPGYATVDGVAPDAPIIDQPNTLDPVTGSAEPNSEVTVTFPDGSTEVTTAGPDGKWSVPNPGLQDGDEVQATAKDPAGNVSDPGYATVDGVAPDAPIIDQPNTSDPVIGSAEPGNEVTVTFPDGSTEVTTAGPDGKWSVPNPGLQDGDEVKATAKDPAGNVSDPGYATVDGAAPNAPHIDPPNANDPITGGGANPGDEVIVTFPNGDQETTTAGPDGTWSVPNPGLVDGDEIKAETKDPEGNVSPPAYAIVDGVAPDAPIIDQPNTSDPVTGSAEPGSEVTVTFPDGSTEVTTAGPDGKWSVPNPGLQDGDEVQATAKDPAGNVSDPGYATVDGAAPNAPIIDQPNTSDPITGSAEPNSEVTVTFPDGSTEVTTAGPDGKWSV